MNSKDKRRCVLRSLYAKKFLQTSIYHYLNEHSPRVSDARQVGLITIAFKSTLLYVHVNKCYVMREFKLCSGSAIVFNHSK